MSWVSGLNQQFGKLPIILASDPQVQILYSPLKSYNMMYLALISCGIYVLYNIISIFKEKVIPGCLSDTYYIWPKYVFPLIMCLISGTLLPVWLELLKESDFQFLAFLTCASIVFVGVSPDYKNDKMDYRIHSICAYIACIISLSIITIVMGYWNVIIVCLLCNLYIWSLLGSSKMKRTWLYIIEHSLFISVFISILIKLITK